MVFQLRAGQTPLFCYPSMVYALEVEQYQSGINQSSLSSTRKPKHVFCLSHPYGLPLINLGQVKRLDCVPSRIPNETLKL